MDRNNRIQKLSLQCVSKHFFDKFVSLHMLSISNMTLEMLDMKTLLEFSLKTLDLSHNVMTVLEKQIFKGQANFEMLNLSPNQIY